MRGNTAHMPRVMLLQLAVGVTVTWAHGVDLGEDTHGYVVEEARDEGRGFSEPLRHFQVSHPVGPDRQGGEILRDGAMLTKH